MCWSDKKAQKADPCYHIRIRNFFINLGLLLGSCIFFFAVIETGLRVTGLQRTGHNPPLIYRTSEHPDISYELKPNIHIEAFREIVTTNSLGFRSPEPDPEKPTIAVLGDSITFGYGLKDNESIPARLNELFPNFNVINAGVPGYNLSQETGVYREKIAPLDPALLILIFYFNDLGTETAILHPNGVLAPLDWNPEMQSCSPIEAGVLKYIPGKCWLDLHSAFYRATRKFINTRFIKEQIAEEKDQSITQPDADSVTEEELAVYGAELDRFAALFPADLPRIFVIWPDQYLHEPSRPVLRSMAESHGFTVIDMADHFGNEMETLSFDVLHPSSNVTKEAAEIIAKVIEEHGFSE